jgi:predicted PurR-regulated permease PerM
VAGLQRIRIPRVLATSIVMAAVICTLVVGAYSLRGQMQTILTQLPEAASKLTGGIASMRDHPGGNIQNVQSATGEIEKAASQATSVAACAVNDASSPGPCRGVSIAMANA